MAWNLSMMTAAAPTHRWPAAADFVSMSSRGGQRVHVPNGVPPLRQDLLPQVEGSEILMLCGAHPVRHGGTTRSQRLGRAGRRVPRRLVLHFSVKLCAEQDDDRRQP